LKSPEKVLENGSLEIVYKCAGFTV